MNRLFRRIMPAVLLTALLCTTANAQKTLDVVKFTRLDNDLTARVTSPVRDHDEGKLCALIRVGTTLTDMEITPDALGIVKQEQHAGELWLYVPYGAKSIQFAHDGFYRLIYQYELPIEEGTVYEMRLGSSTDTPMEKMTTQQFVLVHQPAHAHVYVDGEEVTTVDGVFTAMMNKGEHSYKVTAEQYEEMSGSFTLDDKPIRISTILDPLFGMFRVNTQPEDGFRVYINGELAGTTPFQSRSLEPESYSVRIEKDKYYPLDTIIRLREGDNRRINVRLTSFADSLFYNRILGGHALSFGVNVGYVMPFVSSSAGGGFTGSPINYSLGDSRENVSYSAQSGFTAGITADLRLYKNLYLMLGANYSQISYRNKFKRVLNDMVIRSINRSVYQGDMDNSYKEDYTMRWIDVPLLASYRFVLTKTGSFHVNLGPYISYGLQSKMKYSGSSECSGTIYGKMFGEVDYSNALGTFLNTYHIEGNFDMYSKMQSFVRTTESGMNIGHAQKEILQFEDSPFSKINYGLRAGVTYELKGFQLGVNYSLQLSNMANESFWESSRIPVFNGLVGQNNMSGYKHRIHALTVSLGYMFRY